MTRRKNLMDAFIMPVHDDDGRLSDLIGARVREDELEQDLCTALHLLHGILTLILAYPPIESELQIIGTVHFKILQLPQGCRIGRKLIELDDQFGGVLESKGIWLKRWVYEPREK